MTLRVVLLSLAASISTPAFAEIALNKINSCVEVGRLHGILSSDAKRLGTCRSVNGVIEQSFMADLGPALANEVCFFDTVQYRILSGFSCVRSRSGIADLLCFRQVPRATVDDFKKNADTKYAEPQANYLASAAACDASNGDSTVSVPSLLPWLLRDAAQFEFGWVVSLGSQDQQVTQSLAHHGFVISTGRMQRSGVQAIEFVNLYVQKPVKDLVAGTERIVFDEWILTIDDANELDRAYTRHLRDQGMRAYGDYTMFDVFARTPTSVDQGDKLVRLESWQDVVVGALEQNGFEEYSDISDEQKDELREKLLSSQPGFLRGLPIKLHDRFVILRSEVDPACARSNGLMIAVVMAMQPDPKTASDFGGVGMAILGVDACGTPSRVRSFVDESIASAKSDFRSSLD